MKPEISVIQFNWENYILVFVGLPTKNNKKRPHLKYWAKEGVMVLDPHASKNDIPKEVLREAHARAAVIFNKF